MRNNKLKISSLILCIFLIIMFFLNIVVSSDPHHLQCCNLDDCEKCIMISNAQNFLKYLAIIGIAMFFISIMYPQITNLKLSTKVFLLSTLVDSKIQFNE